MQNGRVPWSSGYDFYKAELITQAIVEWLEKVWQAQQWPKPIPVEPDLAAAARAVACVRLVKG